MEAIRRIGDYEVLEELGSGGMGRVFRVRNVISDRVEAMKVLLPDLVGRQDLAARFVREIKVLAALDHPNIAALHTALTADNQLVMIMEYVEGQSLATRLSHGPIATADALTYVDQVLDALGYAHDNHVVHRDIKPANMMLTHQGIVKLTDFGIARSRNDQTLTVTGTTTGSLSYMSPEQVHGEATDARSDLYSVGISLYEMVTGQRPFEADSDFAVMLAHLKEQPKPPVELQPGLGPALNDIILKAIAKEPAARFQSAGEFRAALAALHASGQARTASLNRTVLSTAAGPTVMLEATPAPAAAGLRSRTPVASDHARTMLDTKTPSMPPASQPRATGGAGPAIPPSPQLRSGHPLLFVALGGALVIGALVATGLYLGKAEAGPDGASDVRSAVGPAGTRGPDDPVPPAVPESAGSVPTSSTPAVSPVPNPEVAPTSGTASVPPPAPAAPPGTAASPVSRSEVAPASGNDVGARATVPPTLPRRPDADDAIAKSPVTRKPARESAAPGTSTTGPPPAKVDAKPVENAQDPAELDRLEQEIDQLAARGAAVNSSLDRMQQQQARQGLGLRGDMAARQESMKINLSRAQEAMDRRDGGRARRYRDLAETDVEALEKFLGR